MIFSDIVKVLQKLKQSHSAVDETVQRVSPFSPDISAPAPGPPADNEGPAPVQPSEFLRVLQLYARVLALWARLSAQQDSESSGSIEGDAN